jgi:hypothetical protein
MLKREELRNLQEKQGDALVSIIVPMEKTYPATDKNPIVLKNLIRETEKRLQSHYDPERVKSLMEKIEELENQIDFQDTGEGIALFVADDMSRLVHLDFPPKEMISVGQTFHTRDLLYGMTRHSGYLLLSLSAQNVRLFRGRGEKLREIRTAFFPASYTGVSRTEPQGKLTKQDTEYEELEDIRMFLRKVDEGLFEIVNESKTPLFIAGEAEYISFLKTQRSGRYITESIHENLSHLNWQDMGAKVYPRVQEYQSIVNAEQLAKLQEMVGYNRYAGGLRDVWKAAKLGQIMTLLVEQGFAASGYVFPENELEISTEPSIEGGVANLHDDIVDDLIELVMSMDGEVIFVADGMLQQHSQIAAILRYAV